MPDVTAFTLGAVIADETLMKQTEAAATRQSQSEISEILSGRQVLSYPVLLRIAEGLIIPRGQMGLAYTDNVPLETCPISELVTLLRRR